MRCTYIFPYCIIRHWIALNCHKSWPYLLPSDCLPRVSVSLWCRLDNWRKSLSEYFAFSSHSTSSSAFPFVFRTHTFPLFYTYSKITAVLCEIFTNKARFPFYILASLPSFRPLSEYSSSPFTWHPHFGCASATLCNGQQSLFNNEITPDLLIYIKIIGERALLII